MPANKTQPIKKTPPEISSSRSASKGAAEKPSFPIVAIGASAGAIASFEKFFVHMAPDSGMAFVIVMHLHPDYNGHLSDLIRQFTPMPVIEVTDGVLVEQNSIYVMPANKDMGIHNGKLLLLNQSRPKGYSQPIDHFLQSLADDQWNRAVAVILSGMGSDGETGVRMIKEKLGTAIVQDPETAEYNSMPLAAIGTSLVDFVLSPEEMPLKLIQYFNHPLITEEPSEQAKSDIRNAHAIQKILMLLRSHTGHDFGLYKKSTITRRIDRRIAFHQLPDYPSYVNFLRENPDEIDVLFNELLIGVTKFFRDSPAFDSLKSKIEPLVKQKKVDEPFRVWIAGCSTGEEAYSIAIVLSETFEKLQIKKLPKIQIFATDLDASAILHAREGSYHDNIVADVSAERLEKFFVKKDDRYVVKKTLRDMIVFAQHNFIKDAPFTRLDLLSCRNVMIYLTTDLQKKIYPIFHYSINPKGILFIGPAETVGGFADLFNTIDPKWKIFERKEGNAALERMIDFPFAFAKQQPISNEKSADRQLTAKKNLSDIFYKTLLEGFTPASILVNEKGDILFSNGNTSRYLSLQSGEAVMNIHKMAREELKYVLGNIVHQAYVQKEIVTVNDIKLKEDRKSRILNLKAVLLHEAAYQDVVLIVFEDKGFLKGKALAKSPGHFTDDMASELEKELTYTKQQLNSTIQQMETSLEELKSTNEELQSTNEELQSTNEESLTTKEELQSLNEELMTMNAQYQSKAEELTRLNNDMKNLLDSTEIGTVFLDNELNILRYTPQVRKLFNLIPTDVGRPIIHVVSNFERADINVEIEEVIQKLLTKEIELKTKNNEWYKVRIMPYRTLDNFISGAVLTFTVITNYKLLEGRIEATKRNSCAMLSHISDAALQVDNHLNITLVNKAFEGKFNLKSEDLLKHSFISFVINQWPESNLSHLVQRVLIEKTAVQQTVILNTDNKTMQATILPVTDDTAGDIFFIILIFKEV
jgi:two-component system CheB/CheR fusion protein